MLPAILDLLRQYATQVFLAMLAGIGTLLWIYLKKRAELKAALHENASMVRQTEAIRASYAKDLEGIKRDHQIEIADRKHQYETRKEQYMQFYKLIDKWSSSWAIDARDVYGPILDKFMKDFMQASSTNNHKAQTAATTTLSGKMRVLMSEGTRELAQIRSETSTLRLVASDAVLKSLDQCEQAYQLSFDFTSKMLERLPRQLMAIDQAGMAKDQDQTKKLGELVKRCNELLISTMRQELRGI